MLFETYKNPDFSHELVEKRRKSTDLHFHDEHELYYMVSGSTKYYIDKKKPYQIESGNFVLIPAGVKHKTDSEGCRVLERVLVSFKDDALSDKCKEILKGLFDQGIITVPISKLENIEAIFSKIGKEYNSSDSYSESLINLYIEEILILLDRFREDFLPNLNETDKIIHKISRYIAQNYTQDLSLDSLSRQFSLSSAHLSRRFKAVAGMGINEYITYVRLLNAERLLKEGKLPITEIAGRCGFNDSNYFSTVFKKTKGITPLKFSHKFKKEEK